MAGYRRKSLIVKKEKWCAQEDDFRPLSGARIVTATFTSGPPFFLRSRPQTKRGSLLFAGYLPSPRGRGRGGVLFMLGFAGPVAQSPPFLTKTFCTENLTDRFCIYPFRLSRE